MAGEIVNDIIKQTNFLNTPVGPKSLQKLNSLYLRPSGQMRPDGNWSVEDKEGFRSLRVRFPAGTHGTQSGISEWVEVAEGPAGLKEAWYGFNFMLETGFNYSLANKLFGIVCGNFNTTDGRFASGGAGPASAMVSNNLGGSLRLRLVKLSGGNYGLTMYIYDHVMTDKYGRAGSAGTFGVLTPGTWHKLAVRVVMNNPLNVANGICQVWVDNVLVGSYAGIMWSRQDATVNITAKGFQMFAIGCFLGGSGTMFDSPIDQSVWKKDFYFWETDNAKGNGLYTANESIVTPSGFGNLGPGTAPPTPQVPQGSVTILGTSVQSDSVEVEYSYSETDATGFQYRLNGGTPETLNNGLIGGLSPLTIYSIEVRAINATGVGVWSSPESFTTVTTLPLNDKPLEIIDAPFRIVIRKEII